MMWLCRGPVPLFYFHEGGISISVDRGKGLDLSTSVIAEILITQMSGRLG